MQLSLFELINEEITESKAPKDAKNKVLLLIDGPNLLNRAYHATAMFPERMMKTPDGRFVNGVHGFLQMLNQYLEQFTPSHLAICFDDGKSWRKLVYPEYKEGRKEQPVELKEQFPVIRDILQRIGIPTFSDKEFEADDYIASLKEKFLSEYPNGEVFIVSNDKDLLQLVNMNTTIIARKNKIDVHYTPEQFKKDYHNLEPSQIIDLKAIEGDTSDNIKGIPGIGEVGALKILNVYGSVENLLSNINSLDPSLSNYSKKIVKGGEQATFCKKLTTLVRDIDKIRSMNLSKLTLNIDIKSLVKVCEEFHFAKIMNGIKSGKWDY